MNEQDPKGRRAFLTRTITIVPAAAALGSAAIMATPGESTAQQAPASNPAANYTPTFFHPDEWAFIQAAVARLIPSDSEGPGAIEAGVPEFIDRQMEGPFGHAASWYMQGPFVESAPEFGYQSQMPPRDVYRAAIAACDKYCKDTQGGKRFTELAPDAQDKVLKALESGDAKFDGVSSKTFFGFLWQNTKEGYLSDPIHGGNKNGMVWQMIGFPGARADFADWIGRQGVKYPLPPVTIRGQQGA